MRSPAYNILQDFFDFFLTSFLGSLSLRISRTNWKKASSTLRLVLALDSKKGTERNDLASSCPSIVVTCLSLSKSHLLPTRIRGTY